MKVSAYKCFKNRIDFFPFIKYYHYFIIYNVWQNSLTIVVESAAHVALSEQSMLLPFIEMKSSGFKGRLKEFAGASSAFFS